MIGPKDEHGYLWAFQDGEIFGWSESNIQYEKAWWLEGDGQPVEGRTVDAQNHIDAICKDRPFDPSWLKTD